MPRKGEQYRNEMDGIAPIHSIIRKINTKYFEFIVLNKSVIWKIKKIIQIVRLNFLKINSLFSIVPLHNK